MEKKPKSESRRRKKICPVRLTDVEAELLDVLAKSAGLSRAAYIRQKTLGMAGARSQKRAKPQARQMAQFMGQIGKIGGNLTQLNALTKQSHKDGLDDQLARSLLREIKLIKEPISDMRAAWLKAMNKEF